LYTILYTYLHSSQLTRNPTLTECIVVSTATMVTRTHHDVTLHVHCPSCPYCYQFIFIEHDA